MWLPCRAGVAARVTPPPPPPTSVVGGRSSEVWGYRKGKRGLWGSRQHLCRLGRRGGGEGEGVDVGGTTFLYKLTTRVDPCRFLNPGFGSGTRPNREESRDRGRYIHYWRQVPMRCAPSSAMEETIKTPDSVDSMLSACAKGLVAKGGCPRTTPIRERDRQALPACESRRIRGAGHHLDEQPA
ncbi:hypothetical protein LZ30DRAFT_284622 [Colletotrichum cereale]|nr:hypothetical protein LZ30DRAFT_284622 [Colletotrichum cereale]